MIRSASCGRTIVIGMVGHDGVGASARIRGDAAAGPRDLADGPLDAEALVASDPGRHIEADDEPLPKIAAPSPALGSQRTKPPWTAPQSPDHEASQLLPVR
jgi:hypothetical protein